jgi:nitrous oxidase accessory protein
MRRVASAITLAAVLAGVTEAQAPAEHEAPVLAFGGQSPITLGPIGRRIAAAEPGDTLIIEAGVYCERLRIDKPLTLIGQGGAIIDGDASGDIVEISAPDVIFRGFVVRNTGISLDKENAAIRALAPRAVIEDNILEDILFGIDLREAPDSIVRGNRIGGKDLDIARRGDGLRLWRSNNSLIENNTIHDGRDAILWYSKGIIVRGNQSHDCRYGLHLMFSDDVRIEGNTFTDNSVGIYLMYSTGVELHRNRLIRNRGPSGYGIGLKETDRFTVSQNVITGNRVGVYIDGSPFTTTKPGEFSSNTIAYNDVGVLFLPSARGNELSGNNFIDNIDQISVAGRGDLSANRFWKGELGNFWSDYTGFDQDGDGVGDFVHEPQTLFENMMDKEPKLRLFLFSPAQQAIEFVGRAVPAVRPEPKFVDEVPLMRPIAIGVDVPSRPWTIRLLAATGLGLFALGAAVVCAACVGPCAVSGERKRTATGGAL